MNDGVDYMPLPWWRIFLIQFLNIAGLGPIFGAVALLLLEEILAIYTEHWMLFLGPILILVVLFARRGLYGSLIKEEH